jgi:nicotinamide riboside kinase
MEEKNTDTLIVNLFGAPGSGKSTVVHALVAATKIHASQEGGLSCEYVSEYAKDLVWEKRFEDLSNQKLVTEGQINKFNTLIESNVDIIITDGPVINGMYFNNKYTKDEELRMESENKMVGFHNSIKNNLNIFIEIDTSIRYEEQGRMETREESLKIQEEQKLLLKEKNIPFIIIKNKMGQVDKVKDMILNHISEIYGFKKIKNNTFYDQITDTDIENTRKEIIMKLVESKKYDNIKNIINMNDWEIGEIIENSRKKQHSNKIKVFSEVKREYQILEINKSLSDIATNKLRKSKIIKDNENVFAYSNIDKNEKTQLVFKKNISQKELISKKDFFIFVNGVLQNLPLNDIDIDLKLENKVLSLEDNAEYEETMDNTEIFLKRINQQKTINNRNQQKKGLEVYKKC